ncbi:MAG: biopolymer transporter ExbD [Prevotella sp.]|nr:biopolymer transporter ExbD [Prevotella sp.]MCM1075254.1 biopolymer transporter ExbD [Ruminococcus sp.]
MAQIENGGGNSKGKNHQKKMTIRVDFTPMVDMNMLLITFFMLCTTMIKTQTMNIVLPSNNQSEKTEKAEADKTKGITFILDAKRAANGVDVDSVDGHIVPELFYYEGAVDELGTRKDAPKIMDLTNPEAPVVNLPAGEEKIQQLALDKSGVRAYIEKRNKATLDQINKHREDLKAKKITKAEFDSLAKLVRDDKNIEDKPVIVIKATNAASYGSLVSLLDEMQINQIATYQMGEIDAKDEALLKDYRNRHK